MLGAVALSLADNGRSRTSVFDDEQRSARKKPVHQFSLTTRPCFVEDALKVGAGRRFGAATFRGEFGD